MPFAGRKMGNPVICQPTKLTGAITININLTEEVLKIIQRKSISHLTDEVLIRHFQGIETIGIYPLLEDNTSFFIAADFDDR